MPASQIPKYFIFILHNFGAAVVSYLAGELVLLILIVRFRVARSSSRPFRREFFLSMRTTYRIRVYLFTARTLAGKHEAAFFNYSFSFLLVSFLAKKEKKIYTIAVTRDLLLVQLLLTSKPSE